MRIAWLIAIFFLRMQSEAAAGKDKAASAFDDRAHVGG